MTNRADFAELFDIDMDELAGTLALVTPPRLGGLKCLQAIEPQPPQDAENRCSRDTGFARDLRSGPALTPQRLDARDGLGVGRRKRCGGEERSCKPATPSARNRATHLRTVRGQTPTASPTASGVCPSSTTRRAMASRPHGVTGAFL